MDTPPLPRRPLKRSKSLVMTTLMAGASVSLIACDDSGGGQASWNQPALDQGPDVPAYAYRTLEACKAADEIPDSACDEAVKTAKADEKNAPRYADQATCEDIYGAGQCVPRSQAGSGSFWGPLITGFVVGQLMNGGWRGTGLYRDYRDGGYYTPYGGRVWTDYATGRPRVGVNSIDPPAAIKQAPPKVQTRASVISRGGFGGRMSARGYGGSHGYGG